MKTISNYLHYIPATSEPLSADVYVIEGDSCAYIYDVGNNREVLSFLSGIKEKVIILSHPHNDHVGNVDKLDYKALYAGDATCEKIGKGTVITDGLTINDGVKIQIRHCPSPHTGGSLIVTINNEYTLLADLYFTRPPFDKKLAHAMLKVLGEIETEYFVVSHQEANPVFEKEYLIRELTTYFQ